MNSSPLAVIQPAVYLNLNTEDLVKRTDLEEETITGSA